MLLLAFGCKQEMFIDDLGSFDPNSNLPLYEVQLSRPGNEDGEVYLDISTGAVYNYADAVEQPEKIDIIMQWSATTSSNIVAPWDIEHLEEWERGARINEEWFVKNETRFIRLKSTTAGRELYDGIKSKEDIQPAYETLKTLVENQNNYDPAVDGEGTAISNLAVGDIVGVRTAKNVYALAKVQDLSTGNTGNLRISFKIDNREETKVDPLPASERREHFDFTTDELSVLGGANLFDLAIGTQHTVTEGYYSQHLTDAAFYLDGNGVTVSSMSRPLPLLGEDVLEVESDWEQRNETQFIRVKASAEATSLFNRSYTNSLIREAFAKGEAIVGAYEDYDPQTYGPALSVSGLEPGDVVLYHVVSRNVYGVILITDVGADYVDGRVRAAAYGKTDPPAPVLKEFTSEGSTSGAAYVDFKNQVVYKTEAEGKEHCADIDIVAVRGSSSYQNFYPLDNASALGAWSGAWRDRVATWPVRNASDIYSLGSASGAWELYHNLSEDETMWDVFQTATSGVSSTQRLYPIQPKEVIFIHSKDRNLLIAVKALKTSTDAVGVYRYKVIEL